MKYLITCIILVVTGTKLFSQVKPLINVTDIIEGEFSTFRVEPLSTKTLADKYHWLIRKKGTGKSIYYEREMTQRQYTQQWTDVGDFTVYVRMRDKNGCLSPQIPMDFTVHPSQWYIKPIPLNIIQCSLTPSRISIGTIKLVPKPDASISFKVAFTATIAGEYTIQYQVEDGAKRKDMEIRYTAKRTTIHEASYVDINIDQTEFDSYYTNTTDSPKILTISVISITNPHKQPVAEKTGGMSSFTATINPRPQIEFK
ncbi:hypothetical protein K5X82_12210 [Halosquirtibacter xylanolyticus]|uniref:hypothetical protein n=1 Tax=Halosquirtibacter xylanolyticus TaxID=3374599 RepID=UPI0037488BF8|nr:hypothetical protein K5X82_12210 [Prolixibacteraceae bacterium]